MIKGFLKSVRWALKGIAYGIRNERNLRIDLTAAVLTVRFAMLYGLDRTGWAVVTVFLFLVPAAELFNTAVERAVSLPDAEHDEFAGIAKDTAAGAVLLCAAGAVTAAVFLFSDTRKLAGVLTHYISSPARALALAAFVAAALVFIARGIPGGEDR